MKVCVVFEEYNQHLIDSNRIKLADKLMEIKLLVETEKCVGIAFAKNKSKRQK